MLITIIIMTSATTATTTNTTSTTTSFERQSVVSSKASSVHRVQSSAVSYKFQYLLFSFRSPSCSLLLFHRLHVPSILRSVTCFIRQFLSKVWPIQLAFPHFSVWRIRLPSLTIRNTSSFLTRSAQLIFFLLFQHHIRYFRSIFQSAQVFSPSNVTFH